MVTEPEFSEAVLAALGTNRMSNKAIGAAFNAYDHDSSGSIDYAEYVLQTLRRAQPQAKINQKQACTTNMETNTSNNMPHAATYDLNCLECVASRIAKEPTASQFGSAASNTPEAVSLGDGKPKPSRQL